MTTAPEAVLDTLLSMPPSRARALLWTALQQQWINIDFMASTLVHRRTRSQHSKRLRRLCLLAGTGSHSEAERRMANIIRQSELGRWRSNFPLKDSQRRVIARLDFAFPSKRIAIEVDGRAFHTDHASFERDRIRQNAVLLMGWTMFRFTWEELTQHRARVVQTVREALARETTKPPRLRADCVP